MVEGSSIHYPQHIKSSAANDTTINANAKL
jgi:hypothetical protein